MQDFVCDVSTYGMNGWGLAGAVSLLTGLCRDIPDYLVDVVILHLVKDSITVDHHIVQLMNSTTLYNDIWLTRHDPFDPTKMLELCFTIPKSAADREPAREHSVGADEGVLLFIAVIWGRTLLLLNLLGLGRWKPVFHDGLCLINIPTGLLDTLELGWVTRLVVFGQLLYVRCSFH